MRTYNDVSFLLGRVTHILDLLQFVGGYYECPKSPEGKRLGPLVGYAGRDEKGRQFVGDVYINFARAEEYPCILERVVNGLMRNGGISKPDVVLGAPEGGKALGLFLASKLECRYVFPEKKVVALATKTSREVTKLVFSRHGLNKGDTVLIVEDVLNNFSTTDKLIRLIRENGGDPIGIAAFFNRSNVFSDEYESQSEAVRLPIFTRVSRSLPQYLQDDSEVAEDIMAGNVVWKPKMEWERLQAAMEKAQRSD